MLLVDKYSVKTIKDLKYNNDLYSKLLLKNNFNNMPNLLIHGVPGSGKNTLINILLQYIYGIDEIKTTKEVYSISGYGNSNVDVEIRQSPYHIIIEPNNSGFDKYLIQELVNEYAKRKIINVIPTKNQVSFKIVLINNVDNLSFYAQTSLRCTMEKYHNTCKFILCGSQITKILEPLRSRCLDIRIPSPSRKELYKILLNVCYHEKLDPPVCILKYIVNECNGNTKTALWLLEYYKCNIPFNTMCWKKYLDSILYILYDLSKEKKHIDFDTLQIIRNIYNTILITNVSGSDIMSEMMQKIILYNPPYPDDIVFKIINLFAEYEMRLSKGKRNIMHLEALTINILAIFNNLV